MGLWGITLQCASYVSTVTGGRERCTREFRRQCHAHTNIGCVNFILCEAVTTSKWFTRLGLNYLPPMFPVYGTPNTLHITAELASR